MDAYDSSAGKSVGMANRLDKIQPWFVECLSYQILQNSIFFHLL